MNEAKSIWKSKTFWVNALTLVATVLTHLSGLMPEGGDKYIVGAITVVNLILRKLTVQPVSVTGGK